MSSWYPPHYKCLQMRKTERVSSDEEDRASDNKELIDVFPFRKLPCLLPHIFCLPENQRIVVRCSLPLSGSLALRFPFKLQKKGNQRKRYDFIILKKKFVITQKHKLKKNHAQSNCMTVTVLMLLRKWQFFSKNIVHNTNLALTMNCQIDFPRTIPLYIQENLPPLPQWMKDQQYLSNMGLWNMTEKFSANTYKCWAVTHFGKLCTPIHDLWKVKKSFMNSLYI